MAKKKYNGPTWEELAEGGMSPKMIEATLAEHGFYDDEEEEKYDIPRHMRLFKLSGDIQDILDNAKFKVEDLIDDYNEFEIENHEFENKNYEGLCLISKTDLVNDFSQLKNQLEITLENSEDSVNEV